MISARSWVACVAIAAAAIAAACGPKRIAAPVQPGQDLIVLLPDSDTKTTGAAGVSNPLGAVDLAAERDAAIVTPNRAPVLTRLSEADVKSIFGDALSALPPAPRRFTVFFRFESDELTDQSQALIPQILAAVKEHAVQDVVVIGHTDTMGTQQANFGLDGSAIEATSVGELDLLVKTPDETPEPRNRRVDIAVR